MVGREGLLVYSDVSDVLVVLHGYFRVVNEFVRILLPLRVLRDELPCNDGLIRNFAVVGRTVHILIRYLRNVCHLDVNGPGLLRGTHVARLHLLDVQLLLSIW